MQYIDLQDRAGKDFRLAVIPTADQGQGTPFVALGVMQMNAAGATNQFGYQQIVDLDAAVTLTIPQGATQATVIAENGAIRYRCDGPPPTYATGMPLQDGSVLVLSGQELTGFKVIAQAYGSGAVVNVQYEG